MSPCTIRVYFTFCRDAQASIEVGKRLHIGRILLPLAGARTSVPSNIQTRISRGRALTELCSLFYKYQDHCPITNIICRLALEIGNNICSRGPEANMNL